MILLSGKDQNSRCVPPFSEVLNQPISYILLDLVDELNNVTDDVDISMNDISKRQSRRKIESASKPTLMR